jgi:hypothetical protein
MKLRETPGTAGCVFSDDAEWDYALWNGDDAAKKNKSKAILELKPEY